MFVLLKFRSKLQQICKENYSKKRTSNDIIIICYLKKYKRVLKEVGETLFRDLEIQRKSMNYTHLINKLKNNFHLPSSDVMTKSLLHQTR